MASRRDLPRRFRPYYDQALAQAELQYGGQGDLIAMLLQDTGRDYKRSVRQAKGGARIMERGLQEARGSLDSNLAAAGLDMQQLAGTPDGRRVSQTYANTLNELSLRDAQADEYQASGVRQAGDAYREDAGKIRQQLVRLVKDQGLYTNSLLGELIEGDRNARRAARQAASEQQFTAEQNALNRDTDISQSLIGQGLDPVTGGKLPSAKSNKPKLTPGQQITTQGDISNAIAQAKRLAKEGRSPQEAAEILAGGREKITRKVFKDKNGNRVPEYVQQTDARGNPKRVKNPAISSEDTVTVPKVPSYQELYVRAAVEAAYNNGGRLTPETVKALRKAGVRVKALPVRMPGAKPKPYTRPRTKVPTRKRRDQPG